MTDKTLQQHINDDKNELDDPNTSRQRRHLEDELNHQLNNLDTDRDPTAFEMYCDENPDALECRIYED